MGSISLFLISFSLYHPREPQQPIWRESPNPGFNIRVKFRRLTGVVRHGAFMISGSIASKKRDILDVHHGFKSRNERVKFRLFTVVQSYMEHGGFILFQRIERFMMTTMVSKQEKVSRQSHRRHHETS